MSTNTANFGLTLREGPDIFNPLSTNENFTKIDTAMQANKVNSILAGTPAVSGNTMALGDVAIVAEQTVVKFTLTSAQQVNKLATGGATYNVVGLDGTSVTISGRTYVGMLTSGVFRVNEFPAEIDAATLDGHAAEYFATADAAAEAKTAAENAAAQAQAATTIAQDAKEAAENAGGWELLWENPDPTTKLSTLTVSTGAKRAADYSELKCVLNASVGTLIEDLRNFPIIALAISPAENSLSNSNEVVFSALAHNPADGSYTYAISRHMTWSDGTITWNNRAIASFCGTSGYNINESLGVPWRLYGRKK